MRSTDAGVAVTGDQPRPDRFDELRCAYHARLHSDLMRLTALRVRLDEPLDGATPYEDIRRVAHGMAGAAAMFEAAAVAGAAGRLEEAALNSRISGTVPTDAMIRAALDGLINVLHELGA